MLPAIPAILFFIYYRPAAQATAVGLLMLSLAVGGLIGAYPQSAFTMYTSQRYESLEKFNRSSLHRETLREYENSHGIVRVIQSGDLRFLQVNSKNESSFMNRDLPTQALLALLPRVYLQRNPEQLLDIGLGTGTTVWFAQKWAGEIDSIEINPAVYSAVSEFFFPEFKQAKNINFISREARYYLANSDKKYDIMTVEPSYPTDAITASLYTREAIEMYRQALTKDGVLSLFIPFHILGTRYSEGVVKTLLTAFDYLDIWSISEGADIIVVASQQPLRLTADEVVDKISEYNIRSLGDLSSELTYARRNSMLKEIEQSPDVPIYTDDTVTLEMAAVNGFLTEHKH